MVLDATANCHAPVSRERLFSWHAALFPSGYAGLSKIKVGGGRDDASGPMQVVSGPIGHQRVHCEALPAHRLEHETSRIVATGKESYRFQHRSTQTPKETKTRKPTKS